MSSLSSSGSASLCSRLSLVFDTIDDDRHLEAMELYESVSRDYKRMRGSSLNDGDGNQKRRKSGFGSLSRLGKKGRADVKEYARLADENAEKLAKLSADCKRFAVAKSDLQTSASWTLAQISQGISTSYRKESDGTLSIKLEGDLEGVPLFEQLAVLREIDLYKRWAPFVNYSKRLRKVTRIETVGWFMISVPILMGFKRDAVFHARGCDCMEKDGTVIIVAESVDSFPGADIPDAPKGLAAERMTVKSFNCLVTVKSPDSANTVLIANLDPKIALPQKFIDFCMKKMAGQLLKELQRAAKKAVKDPFKNPHSVMVREDEREFYEGYLFPKFKNYANSQGWDMPAVKALQSDLSEEASAVKSPTSNNPFKSRRGNTPSNTPSPGRRKGTLRKIVRSMSLAATGGKKKEGKTRTNGTLCEIQEGKESTFCNTERSRASPKLVRRYEQWMQKKVSASTRGLHDAILELPVWGVVTSLLVVLCLKFLSGPASGAGHAARVLISSLTNILSLNSLFALAFLSLQGTETRKRRTLESTYKFARKAVFVVSIAITVSCYLLCQACTLVQRSYASSHGSTGVDSSPPSLPYSDDSYGWGLIMIRRLELSVMLTNLGASAIYYATIVLMRTKSEATVNASEIMMGFILRVRAASTNSQGPLSKLGIVFGRGALNRPENIPGLEHLVKPKKDKSGENGVDQGHDDRRLALQRRLQERRAAAANEAGLS